MMISVGGTFSDVMRGNFAGRHPRTETLRYLTEYEAFLLRSVRKSLALRALRW
jgi:hypothetical protein